MNSRELDARVALKVMRYEPDETSYNFKSDIGWFCIDDWSPSTNIADAWGVVEEMRDRFDLYLKLEEFSAGWRAEFSDFSSKVFGMSNKSPAPLAICKCALAVMDAIETKQGSTEGGGG